METKATQAEVWRICDEFAAENRKITGRAIKKEIGGSLETIYSHIDSWREHRKKEQDTDIPTELRKTLLASLDKCAQSAIAEVTQHLNESNGRVAELLEESNGFRHKIAIQEAGLAEALSRNAALGSAIEVERRLADQKITDLSMCVETLNTEKNDLVAKRSDSQVEAAILSFQLGNADEHATRQERRVAELEMRVASISVAHSEAEKLLAVEQNRLRLLEPELTCATQKIASLELEKSSLHKELNAVSIDFAKSATAAEQLQERLTESMLTNSKLCAELEGLRHETTSITERMLTKFQEYEKTLRQLQDELRLAHHNPSGNASSKEH